MRHRSARAVPFLFARGSLMGMLLMAMLMTACDGAAPTETYELSGRVTVLFETPSDDTQIAGARVVFTSDTLIATETVTDEDGRYRMRVQTDHAFGQVSASADGFLTNETTVYFDSPQRRIDIALRRQVGEP